jgi:pyruvate ferredoxin oxidoreductase alpha subunit
VTTDVAAEFEKISDRKYDLFETYLMEDAETSLIVLNSAAGTSKDVVDEARDRGIKVGLLKPRLFRPFPHKQIGEILQHLKAVCVLDRSDSFGAYGPLFTEIAASLYNYGGKPRLLNRIYGLGGRDFLPEDALQAIEAAVAAAEGKTDLALKEYLSVRG